MTSGFLTQYLAQFQLITNPYKGGHETSVFTNVCFSGDSIVLRMKVMFLLSLLLLGLSGPLAQKENEEVSFVKI